MGQESNIIQYYIKRLYDKGLTTMSGGNLSIKSENGVFVTPSEVDKGGLTPEDMMWEKPDGTITGKHRVTSEFPVHKAIYDCNPGKGAVLHSHTSSILGTSAARRLPELRLYSTAWRQFGGKIGLARYAEPGTPDLALETTRVLDGTKDGAILENHGVFLVGETMESCYDQLEDLDLLVKIESGVHLLGGTPALLSPQALAELENPPDMAIAPLGTGYTPAPCPGERRLLLDLLQRAYHRQISTCKNCCISLRLPSGDVLVNPGDFDVLKLTLDDLVVLHQGRYLGELAPHQDAYLHLSIYEHQPKLGSVITARPPYAMAYGACSVPYSSRFIPECYGYLRDIEKLPFCQGPALCQALEQYFDDFHVSALVQNHLFVVAAEHGLKAYDRLEVAESTAQALHTTAPVAAPVEMDDRSIQQINRKCGISR